MKKQILPLIITCMLASHCKKQSSVMSVGKEPMVMLVSTEAILLDTVWSAPKRYMHFLITFDVIAGDSNMYFSQLPTDYQQFVKFCGPDTVHDITPYRPLIIPDIPEVVPESDVFKIIAHDTVRISYFGMLIAHGPWTQFYMQSCGFPYSSGQNDDMYESKIRFDTCFTTNFPQ
ncbi:MAG TPA: hypothetical protein PKZ56_02855 [Candidatus Paceibacterota bacterium]|nr:hypothetical protein [Candidatus Paceibacterota bacterium]